LIGRNDRVIDSLDCCYQFLLWRGCDCDVICCWWPRPSILRRLGVTGKLVLRLQSPSSYLFRKSYPPP